jgi:hypothetical protein
MGSIGAILYGGQNRSGAPYSATVKTTHEQKLADGNAIHGSTTTHQARDSAGRTMTEIAAGCTYGPDGQLQALIRITVNDSETRTLLSWTVNDSSQKKIARVVHQPELVPAKPSVQTSQRLQAAQMRQRSRTEVRSENLGSKIIAGVMAEGNRMTRTVPAGEEGNDLQLEIVDETWTAKDLGLIVVRISDDPRHGRDTTEIVELKQGEPDPALFVPRADYTLEEQSVKAIVSAAVQ